MNASSRSCRVQFERAHVINAEPLHLQVRVLVKVVRVVPPGRRGCHRLHRQLQGRPWATARRVRALTSSLSLSRSSAGRPSKAARRRALSLAVHSLQAA